MLLVIHQKCWTPSLVTVAIDKCYMMIGINKNNPLPHSTRMETCGWALILCDKNYGMDITHLSLTTDHMPFLVSKGSYLTIKKFQTAM